MEKPINVWIAGRQYRLVGEEDDIIQKAAEELNTQYEELRRRYSNEETTTLTVLAALNIAEKYIRSEIQNEINTKYVAVQLTKMTKTIEEMNLAEAEM
ncbi:MAG: hypothetical protein HW421_329 [Ignavibacteria bacterium]|nr:hypothetical protein [Ignavibacteria bacterium]